MIEPELSLKLSENMIAIPFYNQDNEYGYAILLVDCVKREKIKTFEINRVIEKYKLRVMTLLDEKTLLLGYNDRNCIDIFLQYNIGNDDLELVDETNNEIFKTIRCRYIKIIGGRLFMTEYFDGEISVYS